MLGQECRDLKRSWGLVLTLTRREIAARHAGTAGGAAWAYVQPLLTIAIYYLVFDVVFSMRLSEHAPVRAVGTYLIVGALPWMAFGDCLNRGANSLLEAAGLLQKNALPAVLFPVRSVLASMWVFGPLMLLLVLVYSPLHQGTWALVALLPLLVLQLVLTAVLAYILAIFAAALRDTVQLVSFLLSLGIFISPVLFPLSQFPANWRWVLWINPMTAPVLGYQSVLLSGAWPGWDVWVALWVWLVLGVGVLEVALRRSRDQLVDWL